MYVQELKQLQVDAGLVDKNALEKLDWMYEGPMATMEDKKAVSGRVAGRGVQPSTLRTRMKCRMTRQG